MSIRPLNGSSSLSESAALCDIRWALGAQRYFFLSPHAEEIPFERLQKYAVKTGYHIIYTQYLSFT